MKKPYPICACGHEKESHIKTGCLHQTDTVDGFETCYCGKYRPRPASICSCGHVKGSHPHGMYGCKARRCVCKWFKSSAKPESLCVCGHPKNKHCDCGKPCFCYYRYKNWSLCKCGVYRPKPKPKRLRNQERKV